MLLVTSTSLHLTANVPRHILLITLSSQRVRTEVSDPPPPDQDQTTPPPSLPPAIPHAHTHQRDKGAGRPVPFTKSSEYRECIHQQSHSFSPINKEFTQATWTRSIPPSVLYDGSTPAQCGRWNFIERSTSKDCHDTFHDWTPLGIRNFVQRVARNPLRPDKGNTAINTAQKNSTYTPVPTSRHNVFQELNPPCRTRWLHVHLTHTPPYLIDLLRTKSPRILLKVYSRRITPIPTAEYKARASALTLSTELNAIAPAHRRAGTFLFFKHPSQPYGTIPVTGATPTRIATRPKGSNFVKPRTSDESLCLVRSTSGNHEREEEWSVMVVKRSATMVCELPG